MKNIRVVFIFSILLSLLVAFSSVEAQTGITNDPIWISAGQNKRQPSDLITRSDQFNTNTIDITIVFPGVWAELVTKNGENYTKLWHDDFGSYREPGLPVLPGKAFNVLIPNGVQVEVLSQTITSKTIFLSQYSLPSNIIPAQIQAAKSEPAPPWTAPDPKQYRSRDPFPQAWYELKDTFQMRDYTIQPIWVNPIRYKAADGQIEIIEKMELRLTWQESKLDIAGSQLVSDSPSFDRLVSQIVINPPALPMYDTKEETKEGYLIITPDQFVPALTDFVTMKENQGYTVMIRPLSLIGYTASEIQTYIKDSYSTFTPKPAYLLLIGDTNFIPGFNKSNYDELDAEFDKTTDLYYGTMDGDFVPDISVGRLPVRSPEDLSIILNKIAFYNNLGFQDWHSQTSFISSCDNYTVPEGSHDHVISNFTAPLNYPSFFPTLEISFGGDRLYCKTYAAREINILDSINNMRGLITYSGHGNVTSWTELNTSLYNITSGDLELLNENNAYSFVSSFACLTNDFGNSTIPSVFGETWMLLENKGAIAFLGSADQTIWGPDDSFERKLFEILYSDPLNPPSVKTAITGALSVISYPLTGIGTEQYYWETYNLLGDPSQKLWLYPDDPYYFITQITEDEQSGLIGSTVEYPINLINYGDEDSFTIGIANNTWPVTSTNLSEVPTKTSLPLTISVEIPLSALPNDTDQVEITITSTNSLQISSIELTTTAIGTFFTHLPLIFR
jgi:hypothetical protein